MTSWMEPVLDHLWQSTLVAAGATLLALAFRGHQARVRHGIWLAASVKFLVPFGVLAGIGASYSQVTEPVTPLAVTAALRAAATPFSEPEYTAFPLVEAARPAAGTPGVMLPWLPALVWSLGTAVIVARWTRRWRLLARLVQQARPVAHGREWRILRRLERRLGVTEPLPLVATEEAVEPGLFGIRRPVLLWPRAMSDVLDDDQIEAIFAHEICHARRRDNLTTVLHMAAEAVFWFYPVTWWIGARLLHERERACDEWVVQRGSEPGSYAEGILRACRFCAQAPLACAAGVTGADLRGRIERIVTAAQTRSPGRLGTAALGLAATVVIVAPLTAGGLMPSGLGLGGSPFLQSPRQTMAFAPRSNVDATTAARARFSSVSIVPSTAARNWGSIRPWANGRLTATGVTLRELITYAYSPDSPLLDLELEGAPAWVATDRFDVVARSPRAFTNDASGVPSELTGMMRNLLADRFGLRVRTETREMAVLDLARADGRTIGLHLSSAPCWRPQLGPPPGGLSPRGTRLCGTTLGPDGLRAEAVPMSWLADTLGARARRIVRDATGLAGRYDVGLTWTRTAAGEAAVIDAALREQLGLTLVPATGAVEVLVVAGARRPIAD